MYKVLNVIDGIGWCGTKEQTYLITKGLAEAGLESHVALSYQHEEFLQRLRTTPVRVQFYENFKKKFSRYNPFNVLRLRRIIKENGYDVVIAHSSRAFEYTLLAMAGLRKRPSLVALRRSGFLPGFLSRHLKYRFADRIVVVSRKVAQDLSRHGFFPDKLRVIESGVDLSRFYPKPELREEVRRELGLRDDELLFLNVANWQPWRKGQEVILKALAELPFRNFKMVFVGHDTNSEEARATFRKYGLEKQCVGLDFRKDVDRLLQGADLFLFGSYSEGIAGALLQAMATGRIVVSTLAGGIPEYLEDGVNGFGVEVGNWKEMKDKILSALKLSSQEREKMRIKAMETARRYSIENTIKKYLQLFEELTTQKVRR